MASSRIRALSVIALLATSGVLAATPHLIATAAGAVGTTTIGTGGWEVQSSSVATQTGAVISTPGFNTSAFFNVTPDDVIALETLRRGLRSDTAGLAMRRQGSRLDTAGPYGTC